MLTRNISNTRKSNWWSFYASKTIGSLRLATLTKYLTISCFTLAILSTLVLNIVSSYSSSKIESNAIDSNNEPSTLANDSSSISLSFSNATGSCSDTSNPANVCMEIPDDGGIATGGHTVTVNAPSDSDYRLTLSSANNETDLANGSNRIASISNPASISTLNDLTDKTWGMSITTSGSAAADPIYGLQPVDNPLVLIDTQSGNGVVGVGPAIDVQYGAKVMDPSSMLAGSYSANLVYTATAIVPPATLTNLVLNDTLLTGQQKEFAVQGTLSSTSSVKLCKSDDRTVCYEAAEVTTYPDTDEAETIVLFNSPAIDNVGIYDVIAITDRGEAELNGSFRVVEQSVCRSGDSSSDCQVDIDAHMIPVKYTGDKYNPEWTVVSQNDVNNPGDWYDYGQKKWANAVTVENYQDHQTPGTVVDNDDVLGYWVYIPRYAYEMQRRDAVDHYVTDFYELPDGDEISNEFIIHFEKLRMELRFPLLAAT